MRQEIERWVRECLAGQSNPPILMVSGAQGIGKSTALMSLENLDDRPDILLGIATGKSRRGLDHLFQAHELGQHFVTTQVADSHPSKPNPSMILACLSETGVEPENAAIVGDTAYDMEMGKAAGVAAIGVGWGYHGRAQLERSGAQSVLDAFEDLFPLLADMWRLS